MFYRPNRQVQVGLACSHLVRLLQCQRKHDAHTHTYIHTYIHTGIRYPHSPCLTLILSKIGMTSQWLRWIYSGLLGILIMAHMSVLPTTARPHARAGFIRAAKPDTRTTLPNNKPENTGSACSTCKINSSSKITARHPQAQRSMLPSASIPSPPTLTSSTSVPSLVSSRTRMHTKMPKHTPLILPFLRLPPFLGMCVVRGQTRGMARSDCRVFTYIHRHTRLAL